MTETTKKTRKQTSGFTAEERAAMREHFKELKAAASKVDGEGAVLEKIKEMPAHDRAMAERLHAVIKASVPALVPRLWYGMPAYSTEDGRLICFFQVSSKFKARYTTLGFTDKAHLDDGAMWPTSYALEELTPAVEAKIAELVKQAIS